MLTLFKEVWDADAPGITLDGSLPTVVYEAVGRVASPADDVPWARVTVRHTGGSQTSLAGDGPRRKFDRFGIITVSVFHPVALARGLSVGYKLVSLARSAFEGKTTPGQIWFRDARIVEVGLSGSTYQWNASAEFRYEELV